MAKDTGNLAREMAAAPLHGVHVIDGKITLDTDKVAPKALGGILDVLGKPTFTLSGNVLKDRQQGWGKDKIAHKDGGLAGTYAYILFSPFQHCGGLALQGSIWCEQFDNVNGVKTVGKDGKEKPRRTFSVSLPFLKAERRDGQGAEAIKAAKAVVEQMARSWRASIKADPRAALAAVVSDDKWSEEVD